MLELDLSSLSAIIQRYPPGKRHEIDIGVDGDHRVFNLNIFPLDKTADPAQGFMLVLNDITAMVDARLMLEKCLQRKVVLKFDTLDAVASHFKVPVAAFKTQIEEYNRFVKAGKDEQFGKPIDKVMKPIEKAPFFIMEGVPKTHHTMGGIMIDTAGRVIDTATQKPVAGLYAAGEVVGGPHGASRLGSCAIPDCLVFGRICGRNVTKEKA